MRRRGETSQQRLKYTLKLEKRKIDAQWLHVQITAQLSLGTERRLASPRRDEGGGLLA